MAAKNPVVVSSIDEALGLLGDFDGAESFILAPLVDEKGGGRRSWHVLRLDKNGDPSGWIKENEAEAEGQENIAFQVPTVDLGADDLPPLPKSKVNLWELCFCDSDAEKMEPRVWIDPEAERARDTARPRRSAAKAAATPEVETPLPKAGTPSDAALLQALNISTRSNERMMSHVQNLLTTVTSSIEQIGKGHAQLGELYAVSLQQQEKRATQAETTRDLALGANTALQTQLAEARASGQGWITLREIYAEKPELLHDGIRDIASAAVAALRSVVAGSDG